MEKQIQMEYQQKAVQSIVEAIRYEKLRSLMISMPTGTGCTGVILEACQVLSQYARGSRFLFLTGDRVLQESLADQIQNEFGKQTLEKFMLVMTYQQLAKKRNNSKLIQPDYVICFDADHVSNTALPVFRETTVYIGTSTFAQSSKLEWFRKAPFVFIYSKEEAVYDGVIHPAEANGMYEEALLGFCKRLFSSYGGEYLYAQKITQPTCHATGDYAWVIDGKQIIVECKSYRDRNVSSYQLQHAIIRLSRMVSQMRDALGVIILLGEFDVDEAKRIYDRHKIAIWDIANLLHLTQGCAGLGDEVGNLAQFAISDIAAKEPYGWIPTPKHRYFQTENNTPNETAEKLVRRLRACDPGQKYATQYEDICADIIKFLFLERFNKLRTQCRTKDGLFRMDMVCAVKEAGSFWGLIRHHYNSHFIVFECKNYGRKLPQELIYSTEKYLFNAALRNVSIMISRKGFSKNAALAADGCLKEHGKLILDITDDDLVKMIHKKVAGEDPADYLIDRLEDTLMPIGK